MKIDDAITQFDRALRVITGQAKSNRTNPSFNTKEHTLTDQEISHSAGLMRVNHVGEICAQALYDSQAVFSKLPAVRQQFSHSSIEEEDHLAWTSNRLKELNSHTSFLNPLWYAGAFTCGLIAGRCGDAISLGFVVETEKQVETHLESHLEQLPINDEKSRAIVDQMRKDEIAHGAAAEKLGAKELPLPVKAVMKGMAKVMTTTAYYI
jgi:ubiquinone biosynthesis monooxygenase Coq7